MTPRPSRILFTVVRLTLLLYRKLLSLVMALVGAWLLLTTEALITEIPEEKKDAGGAGRGRRPGRHGRHVLRRKTEERKRRGRLEQSSRSFLFWLE